MYSFNFGEFSPFDPLMSTFRSGFLCATLLGISISLDYHPIARDSWAVLEGPTHLEYSIASQYESLSGEKKLLRVFWYPD